MSQFTVVQQFTYLDQNRTEENKSIQALIRSLASSDGWERKRARHLLVEIGEPAVEDLVKALADPRDHVRWEAAETLSEIRDPRAAPAFVQALQDSDGGVRWIAVSALTGLRRVALPDLLKALMQHSESFNLRAGARCVLHAMAYGDLEEILGPVLAALDGPAPIFEAPIKAHTALHALRGEADHRLT